MTFSSELYAVIILFHNNTLINAKRYGLTFVQFTIISIIYKLVINFPIQIYFILHHVESSFLYLSHNEEITRIDVKLLNKFFT